MSELKLAIHQDLEFLREMIATRDASLKEENNVLRRERDELAEALKQFQSDAYSEWGAWLAWIVNGAPTREQGTKAANQIIRMRLKMDAALSRLGKEGV